MVIRHLRQIRSEKELELELQRIPHVFAMYKVSIFGITSIVMHTYRL